MKAKHPYLVEINDSVKRLSAV